ncbi:MAG: Uma2 family endonuclease [Tildeniella nuda ZEHNDER 1965/U140]|jgi:Uma2 family endonuclease|nr:Uma2 family endonuclease [Tildeniella nuda ZEHNDER 1965/U140]
MVAHFQKLTPQAYLNWEQEQELRYEYVNGDVFAMTGGTISHGTIALNLATALKPHLRGSGCRVFNSDVKVGITGNGPFHYPDLSVSCDERDRPATQFIEHPCLIVEVLSPATEAYDRGGKFAHYRTIKTLQEYVLVDADRISVECFRLNAADKWELTHYLDGDELELASITFRCPIALLYEDVQFQS